MAVFRCKMCGAPMTIDDGIGVVQCEYCGSSQTIPNRRDDAAVNMFNRANSRRMRCEFDRALDLYERLLDEYPSDAEAHWGAMLSRYGIEYVEEPGTKKRVPTFHRIQYEPMLSDHDYLEALEHADSLQREEYERQGRELSDLQKRLLDASAGEEPYDVFICYKDKDGNGGRTEDSILAYGIYKALIQDGWKVFFSAVTLEGKLGIEYEPCIFAALNSAKVMVVVGTDPEHFNAVWVRNEWKRYLELMEKDASRHLIPCFKDMDPYDLPDELSHLQALDLSGIGSMVDLIRGVGRFMGMGDGKALQHTPSPSTQSFQPLLERAGIFLDDGDFKAAAAYFDKVLDLEPKCSKAYMGKVLSALGLRKEEDLAGYVVPVKDDLSGLDDPFWEWKSYGNAVRFADPAYLALIEECTESSKAKTRKAGEAQLEAGAVIRRYLDSHLREISAIYSRIKVLERDATSQSIQTKNLALRKKIELQKAGKIEGPTYIYSYKEWLSDLDTMCDGAMYKAEMANRELEKRLNDVRRKISDLKAGSQVLESRLDAGKIGFFEKRRLRAQIEDAKADIADLARAESGIQDLMESYLSSVEYRDAKKLKGDLDEWRRREREKEDAIDAAYGRIESFSTPELLQALEAVGGRFFDCLRTDEVIALPLSFLRRHFRYLSLKLLEDPAALPTRILLLSDEEYLRLNLSDLERTLSPYALSKMPRSIIAMMDTDALYSLPASILDSLPERVRPKMERFDAKDSRPEEYRIHKDEKEKMTIFTGSAIYQEALKDARERLTGFRGL